MDIFNLASPFEFDTAAMQLFHYQASSSPIYKRYLSLIGLDEAQVQCVAQIPFLPIGLFKHHTINCFDRYDVCFTSSGTTTSVNAKHYVYDVSLYEQSFLKAFTLFYGHPANVNMFALLPSYLEREGSSLIYMVERLMEQSSDSGFFLYDRQALIHRLEQRDRSRLTVLFGVSFALLDLAEAHAIDLSDNVIIMETGGMKGRRDELPRDELHRRLKERFGVSSIHSEYGMCECLSQSYSDGDGIFSAPPWMKIIIRDLHDPFHLLGVNRRGGVNIIDLANRYSCAFLQTEDMGICYDNNRFAIEGRIDYSDIRGCNLLL